MAADHLVRHMQGIRALDVRFVHKKARQAFVKALPQYLVDEPHHIGKSASHHLVCVIGQRGGYFHNAFIDFGGDHHNLRLLFRFYRDVKLNTVYHARRGEQTDIPFKQTVQRYLPAVFRNGIGAELPGANQKKTGAVG